MTAAIWDVVGVAEITERLGVTSQTVSTWQARRRLMFPAPVARLRMGPVWHWGQVRAWADATDRLPASAADRVSPAELRDARAAIVAELDSAADNFGCAAILEEPLRRPTRREALRDGRGRMRSQDGRGNGRGEWDTFYTLSQSERARVVPRWTHPQGIAPDVLADVVSRQLGRDLSADEALERWIHAARLVGMADALRRGIVPRCSHGAGCACGQSDAYGGQSPSDLFPDIARRRGDLAAIFGRNGGAYLAAMVAQGEEYPRERVCRLGPSPLDLEYVDYAAEVLALREADEDQAAGRLAELEPWDVLDALPEAATLEDQYVAVIGAYLECLTP